MNTRITAKDFFLQLGAIVAFYASFIALVALLFRVIDVKFPVMRTAVFYGSDSISFQVATLIVAFPIFILLSWILERTYAANPDLKENTLRKWLSYITLFIAGAIIAGDLITVIYRFLDGQELTTGFLLKVFVLLILAGATFMYFLLGVKNIISLRERRLWRWGSLLLVLVSIIIGFMVVGSPATQRSIRLDNQRLGDLQNMQWQVVNYYQSKGFLPNSLEDLKEPISGYVAPVDPKTGKAYEYIMVGQSAKSFQLCAMFDKESPGVGSGPSKYASMTMPVGPSGTYQNESWYHTAGRYCFDRTIDPQFYPLRKI